MIIIIICMSIISIIIRAVAILDQVHGAVP